MTTFGLGMTSSLRTWMPPQKKEVPQNNASTGWKPISSNLPIRDLAQRLVEAGAGSSQIQSANLNSNVKAPSSLSTKEIIGLNVNVQEDGTVTLSMRDNETGEPLPLTSTAESPAPAIEASQTTPEKPTVVIENPTSKATSPLKPVSVVLNPVETDLVELEWALQGENIIINIVFPTKGDAVNPGLDLAQTTKPTDAGTDTATPTPAVVAEPEKPAVTPEPSVTIDQTSTPVVEPQVELPAPSGVDTYKMVPLSNGSFAVVDTNTGKIHSTSTGKPITTPLKERIVAGARKHWKTVLLITFLVAMAALAVCLATGQLGETGTTKVPEIGNVANNYFIAGGIVVAGGLIGYGAYRINKAVTQSQPTQPKQPSGTSKSYDLGIEAEDIEFYPADVRGHVDPRDVA